MRRGDTEECSYSYFFPLMSLALALKCVFSIRQCAGKEGQEKSRLRMNVLPQRKAR